MKVFKTIFYNILFFFLFILLIEIIFGYWFDKDNLGPYMREHRMKKNFYSLKYNNQNYEFLYKRNYHGFRGEEIPLNNIKAVMIGGSTTDERYKPEEKTIVGILNQELKDKDIDIRIVNAGIEGQSTRGHIFNFEIWFPKLKNFKPKYFLFYVGINDHLINLMEKSEDGHIVNPSNIEKLKDNFKSRSILYDLSRKIKHKYYNKGEKVEYDFDNAMKKRNTKRNFKFLTYEKAIKAYNMKNLTKENNHIIKNYLLNIDRLAYLSEKNGAKPIFINQLTEEGNFNKKLFILNYSLIKHCKNKGYSCIDLASKLEGKEQFWWDGIHTTPKGSEEIVKIILPELIKYFK